MPEIFSDFDRQNTVIWVANDTSVSVEAMYAGFRIMVQAAHGFNLCPLQGIDEVKYVRTLRDIDARLNDTAMANHHGHFFVLDKSLVRWHNILNL